MSETVDQIDRILEGIEQGNVQLNVQPEVLIHTIEKEIVEFQKALNRLLDDSKCLNKVKIECVPCNPVGEHIGQYGCDEINYAIDGMERFFEIDSKQDCSANVSNNLDKMLEEYAEIKEQIKKLRELILKIGLISV